MDKYIETNPAILALDEARAAVQKHIKIFGPIATMTAMEFATLKDLNAEVTRCQNEAFNFYTVSMGETL